MADISWKTLHTLSQTQIENFQIVKDKIFYFQFYQLLRITENNFADIGCENFLRFSSNTLFGFPTADLQYDKAQESLQLNFMSLSGVDSPLPHYFSSNIAKDPVIKCFVDIINQRVYQLLYAAWKKFHPEISENSITDYLSYLCAISGDRLTLENKNLFTYTGIFGSRSKSVISLVTLLAEFISAPVRGEEYILQNLSLSPGIIGSDTSRLGDNLLIGRAIDASKIRLHIGPIKVERLLTILSKTYLTRLNRMIRNFVSPFIDYDFIFYAKENYAPPLGRMLLGWTSWLGYAEDLLQLKVNGTKFSSNENVG
jgi:type VI secretion system ImpH/TssG family protein